MVIAGPNGHCIVPSVIYTIAYICVCVWVRFSVEFARIHLFLIGRSNCRWIIMVLHIDSRVHRYIQLKNFSLLSFLAQIMF